VVLQDIRPKLSFGRVVLEHRFDLLI
jgi:hypothetical protein